MRVSIRGFNDISSDSFREFTAEMRYESASHARLYTIM